jgi:agmatinase
MSVSPTFLGVPNSADDDALGGVVPRIVLFGAGFGSAYPGSEDTGHALAADMIRAASQEDAPLIDHFDFDLGGPLFDGKPVSCIDIGNIKTTHHDNAGNRASIETQTREVLDQKALPILLGGDCSVTIPFLSAFAGRGPIWVLQIDAHIDWRDEVRGERYGYSSPMRRASEMPDVAGMVQVGLRSVGSARPSDVNDALAYGSRFVTARDMHSQGVEAALSHIPDGANVVISLDCDSIDPAIMPGVAARTPGGLTYTQIIDLISVVGKKARIAGFDLVEFYPPADVDGISALTAARILVNTIGTIVRQD